MYSSCREAIEKEGFSFLSVIAWVTSAMRLQERGQVCVKIHVNIKISSK